MACTSACHSFAVRRCAIEVSRPWQPLHMAITDSRPSPAGSSPLRAAAAAAGGAGAPPGRVGAAAGADGRAGAAPGPGRAKATIFEPGGETRKLPPPAVTTTYCRPSVPMKVIGMECAAASSSVSHSNAPVDESKALNLRSIDAPTNTSPLAVAMAPPMLTVPVSLRPRAFNDS